MSLLLKLNGFEEINNETHENMIKYVFERQPKFIPHKDETITILDKYYNPKLLNTFFTDFYLDYFTEKEIDDLIKFYSTPLGKKESAISLNLRREYMVYLTNVKAKLDHDLMALKNKIDNK